ncbi:MAG: UxaA family hydrolase [Proteobacteria bacterium]|nr:UxaA family hydrolase [Pseudomonadota bacterium]
MNADAPRTIRLGPADNVIVALGPIKPGTAIAGESVTTTGPVPSGHKLATAAIASGEAVRKFNQIIGFATAEIGPGDHVHTHNCGFAEFARDYAYGEDARGPGSHH